MQLTEWPLRQSLAIRIALAGAWTLLALPAIEFGYRLHVGRPVLATENWRAGRIEDLTYGDGARFDPHLGWAPIAHYASDGYNTLEHGIRRNGSETEVRTGAVLAVGDAFTNGGFDVADDETWPAHLERLLGAPVLNAGVDGFAADQIVTRAEKLLPEVEPKTLVVGLTGASIARAGLSFYRAPKPYYTIDKTGLVHNGPRPLANKPSSSSGWSARVREALGYSALLDSVLSQVAQGYWLGEAANAPTRRAENDPVAVTCALLKRLKTSAEKAGARVLVLMQHSHKSVAERTQPGENTGKVAACAGAEGLTVVDQFAALRGVAAKGTEALDRLYLNDGRNLDRDDDDGFGRMSEEGNRQAAVLLAQAIQKSLIAVPYPGAGETGVAGSAAGGG